jgi:hypothetical protein
MVSCSFTQMATAALGTALLADYDMRIAIGAWAGRFGLMYTAKVVRRDMAYYLPIRGIAGVLVAWCWIRPAVLIVADFTLFLWARHPYEMGCVQWWSGRAWAWLLLVASVVLRAQRSVVYDSEPLPTNATLSRNESIGALLRSQTALSEPLWATGPQPFSTTFLVVVATMLFIAWLLSHLAFFCLIKREYWPSFCTPDTAAAHVKRRWRVLSDEKRAAALVKMHPDVLRLIAADARLFIEAHWSQLPNDRPAWMNERWLRAVPSSVLPRKVLKAIGGKRRRRSTLAEQIELLNAKDHPVPDPVILSNVHISPPDSVVVEAASPTALSAREFLAVGPTAAT